MCREQIVYIGSFRPHTSDQYRVNGFLTSNIGIIPLNYDTLRTTKVESFLEDVCKACYDLATNFLFINKGGRLTQEMLSAIRERLPAIKIIIFYGDMRATLENEFVMLLPECDMVLVNCNDDAYFKKLRQAGAQRVGYLHSATDLAVFKKNMDVAEVYDVSFFGSNYGSSFPDSKLREDIVMELAKKFKRGFLLHGNNWSKVGGRKVIFGKPFANAVASSKISIGISAFNDINEYSSNRLFNCMAGSFHLVKYFRGLESMFTNHKHLAWFHDITEMHEMLDFYLSHPSERLQIYQSGFAELANRHTYQHRAKQVMEFFKELP